MSRTQQALDELLILDCQRGDPPALELLARRWQQRMLAHARRLTGSDEGALDVTQDAWVAIVRGLPRLADPARFPAWALRIVANKSRDWIRGRQRRRRRDEAARQEPIPPGHAREPDARPENDSERVRAALARLDDDRRTVLALHYRDALSVEAIAVILSIPVGTAKSRLFRARNQLRLLLEETP